MKDKIKIFIHNFINPIIVIVYILLLCVSYYYQSSKIYNNVYLLIIPFVLVFILGFILLVWFLTSIILACQDYRIHSLTFRTKKLKIVAGTVVLMSSVIYGVVMSQVKRPQNHSI